MLGYQVTLLLNTEDIQCHEASCKGQRDCGLPRQLCKHCALPVCFRCQRGLESFEGTHQIPEALANDNYYGYVVKLLANESVTWLEVAASNLVWSTIMVYYMEEPFGHLMGEQASGCKARTMVRGNVFSFALPWQNVAEQCQGIIDKTVKVCLPHGEDVLCQLVHCHINGGVKDLAEHIKGLTIRPAVVVALVEELRTSGWPGYESEEPSIVKSRAVKLYGRYNKGDTWERGFMPNSIKSLIQAQEQFAKEDSLVHDKPATPGWGADAADIFEEGLRPLERISGRQARADNAIDECYAEVFGRYSHLKIQTSSSMVHQFTPTYIGMANPFTIPFAVGCFDMDKQEVWRRWTSDRFKEKGQCRVRMWPAIQDYPPEGQAFAEKMESRLGKLLGKEADRGKLLKRKPRQVPASMLRLQAFTRSTARRAEGQFRRHWTYIPFVWNLYFRMQLYFGASLSWSPKMVGSEDPEVISDAASAAADLYQKLMHGSYIAHGKNVKIAGDVRKLPYAVGLTSQQSRILANFRFRSSLLPGTGELRRKMGRVIFWANVVYGHGIFWTFSFSERHNFLAVRLSRYRAEDPYMQASKDEAEFASRQNPSIETWTGNMPAFDLRKLISSRDPVAAMQSFWVHITQIISPAMGVRFCLDCPQCSLSFHPCADVCGSVADYMGGSDGRTDALVGAVEAQKTTGALQLHWFQYGQRLHQHCSMEEIARRVSEGLADPSALKQWYEEVSCAAYPKPELRAENEAKLEGAHPNFKDDTRLVFFPSFCELLLRLCTNFRPTTLL